ncbi:MAG: class I adenylate-forming enzyme family protein [Mycobacterium sp.]
MIAVPENIPDLLARRRTWRPEAIALEGRSGTLTYQQLDAAASCAAGALYGRGIRPGDRIAVCLPNDVAIVVAFYAAMRLGAVWVGIGGALAGPEKRRLIAHSAPRLVLATPEVAAEVGDQAAIVSVVTDDPNDEWAALLGAGLEAPHIDIDAHAPAGIAYTSGTTGAPKGIVHSQHNLLVPGTVVVAERGYGAALRKGDCLPLTILNVMVLSALLTAAAGGRCVAMDRRDARGVAEWIRESQLTVWNGVPTQLADLIRDDTVSRKDLQSLQEVWCGGAGCRDDLRLAFDEKFGHPVRATYGLTEVPTIVTMDPVGDQWKPGASGRTLPHLRLTIRGENDDEVAPGVAGELCVAAHTQGRWAGVWTPMLGLWGDGGVDPNPHGSLHTGDLGTIDRAGWVRVLDRSKLLIVRGGANVYPSEIETILLAHPSVTGAAVFGVADDRLGEKVAALVEIDGGSPRPSGDDLTALCASQLARYKVPETWGFVDVLPRNAMGKIIRSDLAPMLDSALQPKDVHA